VTDRARDLIPPLNVTAEVASALSPGGSCSASFFAGASLIVSVRFRPGRALLAGEPARVDRRRLEGGAVQLEPTNCERRVRRGRSTSQSLPPQDRPAPRCSTARQALDDPPTAKHLCRTRPRIERLLGLLVHRYGPEKSATSASLRPAYRRSGPPPWSTSTRSAGCWPRERGSKRRNTPNGPQFIAGSGRAFAKTCSAAS
jgi:hypothetical protein